MALGLPAAFGQTVPAGSKIFIAPMDGNLHGFIVPEIIKKKLPVTVVIDEKDAEFILTGASIEADDKWYHSVFGGEDKNEGNVRLVNVKEKALFGLVKPETVPCGGEVCAAEGSARLRTALSNR